MNAKPVFAFSHISKRFKASDKAILKQAQITLTRGECILLSGKNGSGKSTLMRILAGLIKPDSAEIAINQQTIKSWKQARKSLRRQIMYLYQEPYMFDGPVRRNLSYALDDVTLSRRQRLEKIQGALRWSRLEHRKDTQAKRLSGGEKQRLALAQAWLKQPAFLLLDEPTANMDKHAKQRTGRLLAEFKAAGASLLIASHDLDHLLPIMDRRLILEDGKLIHADNS